MQVDALHSYTVLACALAGHVILSTKAEQCEHRLYGNDASTRTDPPRQTLFGFVGGLAVDAALALKPQVPRVAYDSREAAVL